MVNLGKKIKYFLIYPKFYILHLHFTLISVIPIEGARETSDRAEGSCIGRKSREEHGKKSSFPDTHRARFLHSAGLQPFSVEMTERETRSTSRLALLVRRSAQGDIGGRSRCFPPVVLSSSRQGAMAGGALHLPPCPQRLPLLFPKSSSILFGSPILSPCESKDLFSNVKFRM